MSATTNMPTSPIQRRDIRSEAQGFKRDKDHSQKWAMGTRPLAGVNRAIIHSTDGPSESSRGKEKVRPQKSWSQIVNSDRHPRNNSNTTPKPFGAPSYDHGPTSSSRIARQIDAHIEATDNSSHPLSKSLLDLLPTHYNNTSPSIATAMMNAGDEGVLYSFDRKDTPNNRVDLSGLVDLAEQKWVNEQTEKIVRGEYEVLDAEGETVLQRQRGRKSPRSKALSRARGDGKSNTKAQEPEPLEDDGFELI
ncbi:b2a73e92-9bd5-46c9-a33c-2464937688e4 [Sclerotinia trifoliorum]|uniref:B2a73e92-9bd5-46c9-a33c-2464937688e4 n=1 Tax=Sclerotinia trifoliorum TaxID=28548 RepID=A0A8H2W1W0_9HELO|nr:b2a73e92-9bd5-46c9-a33c-2464937688e4 [Sclerotinia trifoliorum]